MSTLSERIAEIEKQRQDGKRTQWTDIGFLLIALKRAITVADDACDKECNPKTCSPCKLLAYLERLAGDDK